MMHSHPTPQAQLVTILADRRGECMAKLQKLQKRGARYGQQISWTETRRSEERQRVREDGRQIKYQLELIDLLITGDAPRCGNFTFVAQLERTPGGVLIQGAPNTRDVGKKGREWTGTCDHCGSPRARTWGYVVEDAKGKRKIVGKSCLRDHLGVDAPASLAARFAFFRDLDALGDEDDSWGAGGGWGYQTTEFIVAASRAAIALWGWRSSSYEGMTTHNYVRLLMRNHFSERERSLYQDKLQLEKALKDDAARYYGDAEKVIKWVRTMKPRTDYLHNLQVAMADDVVRNDRVALVVSASATWDRQQEVEAERKAKEEAQPKSTQWFGIVGERHKDVQVTLERIVTLPDYGFGPSWIHVMRLADGTALSWKTNTGVAYVDGKPVELGKQYRAAFTVKLHTEFREQKETRVQRCVLTANPAKE
jgi:hypothetical protein